MQEIFTRGIDAFIYCEIILLQNKGGTVYIHFLV